MKNFATRNECGLWIVDVQQRLFPHVDRSCEVLDRMCFTLRSANILGLPLMITEQYPEGLGHTIEGVQRYLPSGQPIFAKQTFSGAADSLIKNAIEKMQVKQWILVGIEAHICVLQTAKDLLALGKEIIVLNDAISSRSIYEYSTAIGEMRDAGVRITSAETVIYELLRTSEAPEFKEILDLVKSPSNV